MKREVVVFDEPPLEFRYRQELPDPRDFLMHLKHKAGWRADYWSDRIQAWRYGSIYLSEES